MRDDFSGKLLASYIWGCWWQAIKKIPEQNTGCTSDNLQNVIGSLQQNIAKASRLERDWCPVVNYHASVFDWLFSRVKIIVYNIKISLNCNKKQYKICIEISYFNFSIFKIDYKVILMF